MNQKTYMIFFRPKGSITYTPVPDCAVQLYTDVGANFTPSIAIAQDIVDILTASHKKAYDYAIFRCQETHVCEPGGGRID